jgi:hypothetical protein
MVLDPSGWWNRWAAPTDVADGRRVQIAVADVVDSLRGAGGEWPSQRSAATALGVAQGTAAKLLAEAVRQGAIESAEGGRGAITYRLPGQRPR